MDYKQSIAQLIATAAHMDAQDILPLIEVPPNPNMGDFAMPCFQLAKVLRKAPQAIATDLSQNIQTPEYISQVQVAGGYLNFFLDPKYLAQDTLSLIQQQGEDYGRSNEGMGRKVVMDYSSINIAKPFHIGHLSTTAIGNSLYRIYNFLGYQSIGINHLRLGHPVW